MAKGTVGVGVIGTGFGVRVQIPVFAQTPGARVVAVCSHDQARARTVAQRFGIPHAVTDYRELASLEEVDLVSVATPPHQHEEAVRAALEAGKHVLCEKPFAMDVAQAKGMVEAARKKGVLHLTNFEFRNVPARAEMRRLVEEGAIGTPFYASITAFSDFVRATEGRLGAWWFDSKCGGGWLGASGSHMIDYLRLLCGEIAAVSARLETVIQHPKVLRAGGPITSTVDDMFSLLLRFASGATGAYLASAAATGATNPMRVEVYGSKGSLVLDGERLYRGKEGQKGLEEVAIKQPELPPGIPDQHYVPFALWTRQMVEAIMQHKRIKPDFEDGLRCQQVLDAARRSAREGREVEVGK